MPEEQWREPPKRVGQLEPIDSRVLDFLDANTVAIVITLAALVLSIAGYVFGVDWLTGHL